MRIRQRRRIRWSGAVTSPAATKANERWSMDFVSDCVSTGKVIRMLTIVDDCTRECPVIEVDNSLLAAWSQEHGVRLSPVSPCRMPTSRASTDDCATNV